MSPKNSNFAMAVLAKTLWLLLLSASSAEATIGRECSSKEKKGETDPSEYQAFFYGDKDFEGDCWVLDLTTDGVAVGKATPQDFGKKNHYSSVKWHFPEGYVMSIFGGQCSDCTTLTNIYNYLGYEMVGTGSVETLDSLGDVGGNLNNNINTWLWFTYEPKIGYVKACKSKDYEGNCRSIFVELFDVNTLHKAKNWECKNRISSMKWNHLGPYTKVTFYEKRNDNPGISFNQAFGWNPIKKMSDLSTANFDDRNYYFEWTQIQPVKEVLEEKKPDVELTYETLKELCTTYNNDSPVTQEKEITVDWTGTLSFSTTVEKSDTYGHEVSAYLSYTPPKDIGGAYGTASASFSARYTDSTEKFEEIEETKEISITEKAKIPPYTDAFICLTISSGTLPNTAIEVSGWRWYQEPVTGGVQDPDNNNYYKVYVPDATTVAVKGAGALYTEMYVGPRSTYERHRSLASNIAGGRLEQTSQEDAGWMMNSTKTQYLRGFH